MNGRTETLRQLGVDPGRAEAVIDTGHGAQDTLPWYVQAMIGVGAWLAAVFAIGLMVSLVVWVFDPNDPEWLLLVLGALGYGGALVTWRLARHSVFLDQLSAVFGVAGVVSMAAAVAFLADNVWVVAAFLALVTLVNIGVAVGRLFQFLVAAMAIVVLQVALFEDKVPGGMALLAVLTLLPGVLLVRFPPPRWEIYPTAIACLFAVPAYDAFLWSWLLSNSGIGKTGWSPLVLGLLAIFAWLLHDSHRRAGGGRLPPGLFMVGLAGGLAILLLPPGGGTLVVVLLLAHAIGSWPLALSASVLEGFFLWRFYYDLQMTLLVKSGILFGIGLLLLGAWILVIRRPQPGVRPPSA